VDKTGDNYMIRWRIPVLLAFLPVAASAHHSFGAFFNVDTVGEIEGELVEVFWVNPHTTFTVRTDDGELWNIETAPVNRLQRLGLANTVAIGDRVGFYGALSRLGRNEILAINMTMPSGEEVLLDPGLTGRFGLQSRVPEVESAEAQPQAGSQEPSGIYRVWSRARGPNDLDPERTFTAAALAARDAWDPVVDDPALRCTAPGMPVVMDTPFPLAFEEGDGRIILRIEQWDGIRSIHMGSDMNPQAQPDALMGYSRGRWEGQTLVVETSNISWPYVDEFGTPKSDEFTMVERFSFSEDSRGMTWEATVNDPATYEGEAFLGRAGYEWVPGEVVKPYDCTIADKAE
jgi:hypothetical protein